MTIKNLNSFKKKLDAKLTTQAKKNVRIAVTRGTMLVQNTAKESILSGNKSGATRNLYNPRRTHTSSAQGEAPANDTGFLASQITMNVKARSNGSIVGQIISAAPYSKALEFGTTNMMARPFMQPALEKNKRRIVNIFKRKGVIS
jgi:HK97 gp10 family phage protein